MPTATYRAGSNIAFIKYWGVADASLNLPLNNSISMTLADAHTTTTVAWDTTGHLGQDEFTIDDVRFTIDKPPGRRASEASARSHRRRPASLARRPGAGSHLNRKS